MANLPPPDLLSPHQTIRLSVARGDQYSSVRLREFEKMGVIEAQGEERSWSEKCELCTEQEVRCFIPKGPNIPSSKCSFCYYRKVSCSLADLSTVTNRRTPGSSATPIAPCGSSRHRRSRGRGRSRSRTSTSKAPIEKQKRTPGPRPRSPICRSPLTQSTRKTSGTDSNTQRLRQRQSTPNYKLPETMHSTLDEGKDDEGARIARDEMSELSTPVKKLKKKTIVGHNLPPIPSTPIPFRLHCAARKTCPPRPTVMDDCDRLHVESDDDSNAAMDVQAGGANGVTAEGPKGINYVNLFEEVASLEERVKDLEERNAALRSHLEEREAEDKELRYQVQQLEVKLAVRGK